MAVQVQRATFANEQGPKQLTFVTPAGNFGVGSAAPTITDNPLVGVSCWCDAPATVGPVTTVNVYATDAFTGYIDVPLEDMP